MTEHVTDGGECWCRPNIVYVPANPTPDEQVERARDQALKEKAVAAEKMSESTAAMRGFDTGATRNVEVDPDIHGFTSPLALAMFARYMHENRTQADGTIRDSDNWKRGIPLDSYIRSMRRHLQDLTLHHDGYGDCAREDLYAALSGLFFNVQGYMHEVAKADIEQERLDEIAEAIENATGLTQAEWEASFEVVDHAEA